MPDVGIQIPPNLSDWWLDLVEAGATDLGGLSANGDHISPEHAFPSPHQVRKRLQPARLRAHRAALRLPAVPRSRLARAGCPRRRQAQVLELHPAAGVGPAQRARDRPGAGARGRSSAAATGIALSEDELTALFAETRPEVIEEMRVAADELRAELAGGRGDVRRQPQHQLHQRLRRRLRLLRLRPGQALARRLPRERGRLPGADRRGGRVRRDRDLHAGRHPPRLLARALRPLAAARQGDRAAASPARLLADGDPLHVRALRPLARPRLRLPARVRPRLDPRHRRGGARRRRPQPGSRRTSCRPAAGSRSSRPATARACARPRP